MGVQNAKVPHLVPGLAQCDLEMGEGPRGLRRSGCQCLQSTGWPVEKRKEYNHFCSFNLAPWSDNHNRFNQSHLSHVDKNHIKL